MAVSAEQKLFSGLLSWLRHVGRMSVYVIRNRGWVAFFERVMVYVREHVKLLHFLFFVPRVDVLFISGCPGGSRYYRCANQADMLNLHGITARIINQGTVGLEYLVNKSDVFILQRVIYDQRIARFINKIKKANKVIIYETDDLVFDPRYLSFMDYFHYMGKEERCWYENGIGREILEDQYVEYCVVSTDYLAKAVKEKYPAKTVVVSFNKMGHEQLALAEKVSKREKREELGGRTIIGYFSGSRSHNKDFDTIADVLVRILKENREVILHIVGSLDLGRRFESVKGQVQLCKPVSMRKLSEMLSETDINIAPLEAGNPFCQAKSALKYFESGIFAVPTIASATGDFRRCIKNGENSFIAETQNEWYDYLTQLVQDRDLRRQMGIAARADAQTRHTILGQMHDDQLLVLLQTILKKRDKEFT